MNSVQPSLSVETGITDLSPYFFTVAQKTRFPHLIGRKPDQPKKINIFLKNREIRK